MSPLLKRARRVIVDACVPRSLLVLRGSRRRRAVALTFDDGPHELTGAYLDLLDAYSARATFFLVGRNCRERPSDVAEIAKRGHELAGHGFTHTAFPTLERRVLLDELEQTHALFPKNGARRLVRPPRGILNVRALARCARAGYTTVLFSLDTLDYKKDVGASAILDSMKPDRVSPGEIILLHEGRPATAEALPRALASLRDAGYAMVTVSELLA